VLVDLVVTTTSCCTLLIALMNNAARRLSHVLALAISPEAMIEGLTGDAKHQCNVRIVDSCKSDRELGTGPKWTHQSIL